MVEELTRFYRLLAHARTIFRDKTQYRAFAVVNGAEAPPKARQRIHSMRSAGVEVDVVRYTPHNWEALQPFVNYETGWTTDELDAFPV
jgi:hypothetical protein